MTPSTLIRSARIIDGSGAAWFVGDALLEAGRIAAVGTNLSAGGCRVVEARGRFLAPGFIDAHCHDDLIGLREPGRREKIAQGVTTVVVGNCSFSLYPAPPASAEALRGHFSTLLGETAPEEMFADFAAYRAAVARQGCALNIVSQVGHAALRLAVMGWQNRPATPDEIAAMQALLATQLAQGATGLSLGLVYPPSAFATAEELVALGETVRDHGAILSAHVRNYESRLPEASEEFLAVLRRSGAAGQLSHLQAAGRPNWGSVPSVIARLEAARAAGIDVAFDMYPYPAGSSYILQLLPPEALEGGLDALRTRLADPAESARLRRWVEQGPEDPAAPQSKISLIGWGNVLISAVGAPALKSCEGQRLDVAAAAAGLAPFDLLRRFVEEDGGQTGIVMFQLGEDDLRAACTHSLHMFCSDGLPRPGTRPHPRAWGAFPRVIGKLACDEGWFGLEEAVRHMTSAPALRFGIPDRGLVRPGMVADLVLFDVDTRDLASFENPTQLPRGIETVWVAGEAVLEAGQPTGARPGRVLGTPRRAA